MVDWPILKFLKGEARIRTALHVAISKTYLDCKRLKFTKNAKKQSREWLRIKDCVVSTFLRYGLPPRLSIEYLAKIYDI